MHHIVRWSWVLGSLFLSVSPALAGSRKPAKATSLELSVMHLATKPCGGLCGIRRGQVNHFRFTLHNTGPRALKVAWKYSCSGHMGLSLALLPSAPKQTRVLAQKNFGAGVRCTRNGPLVKRLGKGKKLSVVLRWKVPRKLPVGVLRLRARAKVSVYAGSTLTSKDVQLQTEQRIPVH